MSRGSAILLVAVAVAISNTVLFGIYMAFPHLANVIPWSETGTSGGGGVSNVAGNGAPASSQLALQFLLRNSPFLSTSSWILVGGLWIWRGKTKSEWERAGFDSEIFYLFTRMKGARTRLSLLGALSLPKDRMQLARELGLDWKAVDYQIGLLKKLGLVCEEYTAGRVRIYRLSESGRGLIKLLGSKPTKAVDDGRLVDVKVIVFPTVHSR